MRYLPLTPEDRSEMLARVGVADIDALFADVPADKRLKQLPDLPPTKSEIEVERVLGRMAAKNVAARCRSSSAAAPTSIMSRRASTT
jgi:glycine dehydrogenase subunit 1